MLHGFVNKWSLYDRNMIWSEPSSSLCTCKGFTVGVTFHQLILTWSKNLGEKEYLFFCSLSTGELYYVSSKTLTRTTSPKKNPGHHFYFLCAIPRKWINSLPKSWEKNYYQQPMQSKLVKRILSYIKRTTCSQTNHQFLVLLYSEKLYFACIFSSSEGAAQQLQNFLAMAVEVDCYQLSLLLLMLMSYTVGGSATIWFETTVLTKPCNFDEVKYYVRLKRRSFKNPYQLLPLSVSLSFCPNLFPSIAHSFRLFPVISIDKLFLNVQHKM